MSVADWIRLSRLGAVRALRRSSCVFAPTAVLLSLPGGRPAVRTAGSSRLLSLPDGKEIEDAILHARHDMISSRRPGCVPGWQVPYGGPAGNQNMKFNRGASTLTQVFPCRPCLSTVSGPTSRCWTSLPPSTPSSPGKPLPEGRCSPAFADYRHPWSLYGLHPVRRP